MKKRYRVKYSPVFQAQIGELKKSISETDIKTHNQLLAAIEREKDNLLLNPHRGIQIEKKKIPKEYVADYGLTNLWKIDLPGYWRMIYTITGNEIEIISILLEFMDHKTYDKKFGYRRK
ncbi:type II toxin-antitoxin system RelE/ParE family toxin [Candidatus Woesearchaeota archaeon]|nr:type II toxin-antitoxin system RelE/ParE family toxin [Candidatus Woesearchaeota archaeon]